jgi:hypothetical protein
MKQFPTFDPKKKEKKKKKMKDLRGGLFKISSFTDYGLPQ